ncbi:phage holin family protein [Fibrobacter sp.]|uniref:phage holin family protein n=1 Tax=Fibrobacter sp. TaxID=35828 RepID=UPI00388E8130
MDIATTGTVAAITILCYLVGVIVKSISAIEDKHIPWIVGVLGGILGIVGMYVMPDFPAQDVLYAAAVGVTSGLASTGANQVYKQLTGK